MSIVENVRLALTALWANKMRALLTMLGIIIGIGAVIGIVTVGDSLTYAFTSTMSDMGAGNIMVMVQQREQSVDTGSMVTVSTEVPSESDLISDAMIDAVRESYPTQIKAVSISESVGNGQAKDGRLYANMSINGVNDGYFVANDIDLLAGRFLTEEDVQRMRDVVVISDFAANKLFDSLEAALGQEVRVTMGAGVKTYTVVGVYKYVESSTMAMAMMGTASDKDRRTSSYIPISTAKRLMGAGEGYYMVTVMVHEGVDSQMFTSTLRNHFNAFYKNNLKYQCMAMSMESLIDIMGSLLGTLSVAIAVIAGISLLVGGIGVMNIMLVSITERTREIGTRKAIGAPNSAIRVQFIVEAVIICTIGGIFGIIVGILLGMFGASLLGYPAKPSMVAAVFAVVFSMMIGIFFGYYPANKAAKLDPIEALRYE